MDAQRVLDLAVGVPMFVATLPLQGAIALMVRRQLGSPVIFRQDRPGKDAKIFRLRKFRTMLPVDQPTGRIDDASRLTPFGHWLRSTLKTVAQRARIAHTDSVSMPIYTGDRPRECAA